MKELHNNPNLHYGALPHGNLPPGYSPQFQAGMAPPDVIPVQEHIQNNPVTRVSSDMMKSVKDFVWSTVIGGALAAGAFFGNNWLVDNNRLEKFLNRLDGKASLQKVSDTIVRGWKGFTGNKAVQTVTYPFRKVVDHFAEHWNRVRPKFSMAVITSRPKPGQMVDSFLDKAVEVMKKPGTDKNKLKKLEKLVDVWKNQRNLRWREVYAEAKKIIGTPKDRGLKNIMGQIEIARKPSRTIFGKFLRGLYTYTNDYFNMHFFRNNPFAGKDVLKHVGKAFGPVMTLFSAWFLGNTIYQTVKAEEGEKTKTFMEGFFGDVIPFALMDKTIGFVYGISGGLQAVGEKSKNKLLRILTKPVRGIGNFLGAGLKDGSGWFKRWGGGATRLIAIFAGFAVVGSLATKLSYKIFGKPKKTIEEEQKAEAERAEREKAEQEPTTEITRNKIPDTTRNPALNAYNNKAIAKMNKPAPFNKPIDHDPPPLVQKYMNFKPAASAPAQGIAGSTPLPANPQYNVVPAPISQTPPEKIAEVDSVLAKIDKVTEGY